MINTVTFMTDIEVFMEYRRTAKSKMRIYMGDLYELICQLARPFKIK